MKYLLYTFVTYFLIVANTFSQYSENQIDSPIKLFSDSLYIHAKIEKTYLLNEEFLGSCFPEKKFLNSVWFNWIPPHNCVISMNIIPNHFDDDIDFVIFKKTSNNGLDHFEEVRCMSLGPVLYGKNKTGFQNCLGSTGLANKNNFSFSGIGCPADITSNYLDEIEVYLGEELFIQVINFGSTQGFSIELEPSEDISTTHPILEKPDYELTLYPNPTHNEININIKYSGVMNVPNKVEIFNAAGIPSKLIQSPFFRNAYNENSASLQLSINELPSGIHFMVVSFDDNSQVYKPFFKY